MTIPESTSMEVLDEIRMAKADIQIIKNHRSTKFGFRNPMLLEN